ncbi:sulfite exporter TauE/SafE family protein [Notoacmeibacter sp. MSK16QG-6]|uniref:sulfite exporter TauE/SafE family protein n=1 Tax=Notoacmeibacter sp. MSK16QG-6 TaxID=2957982 RepID=UPI00209F17D1|nr:sulfite exporter TauE/SafE family protein [Notoacmeibacter sp. MSK16QG-6]MCP1200438.1 sulfite exporter TauE/SafE family protein [Notoacmeibacter sp. MSK16QG-6]
MITPELLVLLLAALIVGLAKGGIAAAGTLAVPLVAFFMDPLSAAALLLPIFIISDVVGVWLYRREWDAWNLKVLIPAGFVGVLTGTLIEPHVPEAIFTLATGLIGLGYCGWAWLESRSDSRKVSQPSLFWGGFWGVLVGLASFVSHSAAPPYQAYVLPQNLPKMVFAGTTTIVFAAINLAKLPAYLSLGLMKADDMGLVALLCVAAIIGTFGGRLLSQWLSERTYLRVIQIILFVLSMQLTWSGAAALF